MNLLIVPTLMIQATAAFFAWLVGRSSRPGQAWTLAVISLLLSAVAVWLAMTTAWQFRDGFPIAAPDLPSPPASVGLVAARRFLRDVWLPLFTGAAGLAFLAGKWLIRPAASSRRP